MTPNHFYLDIDGGMFEQAWGGPPRQSGLPESTNLQNKCIAKDGGRRLSWPRSLFSREFTEMQFILHTDSIRLVNSAVGRRDTKVGGCGS